VRYAVPPPPPPPPHLTRARVARPIEPIFSLVTDEDYPPAALQKGMEGMTQVRLNIRRDGSVAGCETHRSSGSPDLDQATCRIMTERARFHPARDDEGRAIGDQVVTAILWRIAPPEATTEDTAIVDEADELRR
jgi:protein TonB